MQCADCCADLIVSIASDIFHQEIDQARITLQDREICRAPSLLHLHRLGGGSCTGLGFYKTECECHVFGQHTRKSREKKLRNAAEIRDKNEPLSSQNINRSGFPKCETTQLINLLLISAHCYKYVIVC